MEGQIKKDQEPMIPVDMEAVIFLEPGKERPYTEEELRLLWVDNGGEG